MIIIIIIRRSKNANLFNFSTQDDPDVNIYYIGDIVDYYKIDITLIPLLSATLGCDVISTDQVQRFLIEEGLIPRRQQLDLRTISQVQ